MSNAYAFEIRIMAKPKQAGPPKPSHFTLGTARPKKVKTALPKAAPGTASEANALTTSLKGTSAPKKVARPKSAVPRTDDRVVVREEIARRLREIRKELFGDKGGPELARRLNLPVRTWYGCETGETVPAEVLLSFIEQTGTNPMFILAGKGPKYQRGHVR